MPPTPGNGKNLYVEIPADDARRLADFYREVLGWRIRQRGHGQIAFDDTTEEVSRAGVKGRPRAPEAGFLLDVRVDTHERTPGEA